MIAERLGNLSRRLALPGLLLSLSAGPLAAQSIADYQGIVDAYIAERADVEGISGVAVYVSLGDPGPAIELFAGTATRDGGPAVSGDTLFQIGSNTKGFTGALLLLLEAEGKLDLDQTVGDWLPQYPAWQDVTLRRLLNMTSGIPTYSESAAFSRQVVEDPNHHFTPEELVAFAYPSDSVDLPPNDGWFYSNTNYILAGIIAEKASGLSYGNALRQLLFQPVGLRDTFYQPRAYPPEITDRMTSGYFENPECGLYEPDCSESSLAPLLGYDVRTADVSWAGAAGGIVSTPRDLARWIRALFAGKILPPQQFEALTQLVSTADGLPMTGATSETPFGFSLGLVQAYRPEIGSVWFYEGQTLGYRVAFLFSPETNILVAGATNSQPSPENDKLVDMLARLLALAGG